MYVKHIIALFFFLTSLPISPWLFTYCLSGDGVPEWQGPNTSARLDLVMECFVPYVPTKHHNHPMRVYYVYITQRERGLFFHLVGGVYWWLCQHFSMLLFYLMLEVWILDTLYVEKLNLFLYDRFSSVIVACTSDSPPAYKSILPGIYRILHTPDPLILSRPMSWEWSSLE